MRILPMRDLKKQAVNSMTVTLGAQAVKFVIGMGVTMVLGRLLTPKDYGVVAMVGVFTGFVAVFRDGGLSIATIQRPNITEAQITTLFWINVALGGGAAVVVALLSPLVGWFYNDKALVWIVLALSVPFVLGGLTAQLQALLQRQMRFNAIAFIEIASLIVSAGIGVTAAVAGWGSWALVTMTISLTASNTALVFFFCRWRPGRPVRGSGVRPMLKFGGELTANKFFDSVACSLDSLLLGKFYAADTVGIYTRAQTVMLLPFSQIMPALLSVALPVMSRLAETPEAMKKAFLDLLQVTACISSFITVFLVVGADWIIGVFLGPQWTHASDVLRLLAGPTLFIPLSTLYVACLMAQGKGAVLWRWSLLKNIATILAIFAGILWGAAGVAAAISIASLLVLLPILNNVTAKSGVATLKEIWSVTGPALGFCIVGCVFLYVIRLQFELESPILGLFILFLSNVVFHIVAFGAFPSARRSLLRVLKIIMESRQPTSKI